MSAKATFWAWEQERVSGNNKLVLLCYAQFSNDEDMAWPGKGTVARLCGIGKSTVKRAVHWLVENGFMEDAGLSITNTDDDKQRETIKYKLNCSGVILDSVQNELGSNRSSSGSTVDPNPIIKHKPTKKNICRNDDWREFYENYPPNKKGGRDTTAWNKFKQLKLTAEDLSAMILDIKQRRSLTPNWFKTYAPGICKYLEEHIWLTPINSENTAKENPMDRLTNTDWANEIIEGNAQ